MNISKKVRIFLSVFTVERMKNTFVFIKREGFKKTFSRIFLALLRAERNSVIGYNPQKAYESWIKNNENYDYKKVMDEIGGFEYMPLISVLMPVYNVREEYLRKSIQSVISQYYENWELCIADDCSTQVHIKEIIQQYSKMDKRIRAVFRTENGHISRATNSALEIAQGEFIALMDNDDEIPKFALFEIVKCLNKNPDADIVYTDEDKISISGKRINPHFKPDYSPDMLLSSNYISHFGVYRKSIADKIGGFRTGFEGAQDYDFVLRFTEQTDKVFHIPKILYHWRIVSGSTALAGNEKNYALEAGYKVLCQTVERRKYNALVNYIDGLSYYDVKFFPDKNDFVSIIIPTRDKADVLEKCLVSVYEKTLWRNFEIIVADNNSSEARTFRLFKKFKDKYDNFNVIKLDMPFNYSKINNEAVKVAKGNLLLFLNNDIEVISDDWLERMAGYAVRKEVGCVGAKLLYPNGKIQHAGVILGAGGVANSAGIGISCNDCGYFARLSICCNYSAVTAACMMVKKSVFEEVGGFEEVLAVAYNDVDFCLKVLKTGRYNIYLPKALLYHYESLSRGADNTPEKTKRFADETEYLLNKWGSEIESDKFYSPNFNRSAYTFQISEKEE